METHTQASAAAPQKSPKAESKKPVSPKVKELPESAKSKDTTDPALLALPSHDKACYYSDSDDDSDRPEDDYYPPAVTNRGNKLKRGARNVRKGKLGGWPRFGTDHEEAVRKKMRIDLTPTLALQSKRTAREPRARLPPLPRNPVELMTSPIILRTFAAKQSHLNTLALSAVNLIEADAPLVRVLGRVCDVLRGDRVPFIEERVKEATEEHRQAAEERKRKADEAAIKSALASAARKSGRRAEAEETEGDDVMQDIVVEPEEEPEEAQERPDGSDRAYTEDALTSNRANGDIPVDIPVDGDMDIDVAPEADTVEPSRSTSPEQESSRRRSGRRAAARATAANATTLSRERTPTPELDADEEDGLPDLPLDQMLQPEVGAAPGSHLPPSLRRLAEPDTYVRSLFVTEEAAVHVPGIAQPLEAEDQYRTLHASLTELQRFLADTTEYQERLGEIRDGALGVERRRKGLFAILRLTASDYLDFDMLRT